MVFMQAFSTEKCNCLYGFDMPAGRPSKTQRCPFGQRLFTVREERGLSQNQIAERFNIHQQTYAAWERRSVALKPEQLAQLASILDTSVDFLVGRQNGHQRKGGPVGKIRKLFEEVCKLPRHQQNKVAEFVDMFLAQHGNGQKQAP